MKLREFPQLITDNQFFVRLSNIPSRYRWTVSISLITLFILIWSFFFFHPLFSNIRIRSREIRNDRVQLALMRKTFQTNKKSLDFYQTKELEPEEGDRSDEVDLTRDILWIVERSKIICLHIRPISGKENFYDIGLRGTFVGVLKFLDRLYRRKKGAKIRKFLCKRVPDKREINVQIILEKLEP